MKDCVLFTGSNLQLASTNCLVYYYKYPIHKKFQYWFMGWNSRKICRLVCFKAERFIENILKSFGFDSILLYSALFALFQNNLKKFSVPLDANRLGINSTKSRLLIQINPLKFSFHLNTTQSEVEIILIESLRLIFGQFV